VSRTYYRSAHQQNTSSAAAARGPWVRHKGHLADVDVRILCDRTEDGGSITRLVDRRGKRLYDEAIVGRPGREDEVALVIAQKVTELLRRK
jgi:hypothetical protein